MLSPAGRSLKSAPGQVQSKRLNCRFSHARQMCFGQRCVRATVIGGDGTNSCRASKMRQENSGHRPPKSAPIPSYLAPRRFPNQPFPRFECFPLSRSMAKVGDSPSAWNLPSFQINGDGVPSFSILPEPCNISYNCATG
jgi:hypothetical protein